jgi:hypothetical protein
MESKKVCHVVGGKLEDPAYHTPGICYAENCGDMFFRTAPRDESENMGQLMTMFKLSRNYPKTFLGIAEKAALCKSVPSEDLYYFNEKNLEIKEELTRGTKLYALAIFPTKTLKREVEFLEWATMPVYEWKLEDGHTLSLGQTFIDGLTEKERKQLKI